MSNPFPGLRPFHEGEGQLFFGRDSQIDKMVDRLEDTRFLAVVGTSGCGKSSLVNCGLKPALNQGFMAKGGVKWRMAHFRPGNAPIRSMAKAFAKEGLLFEPESLERDPDEEDESNILDSLPLWEVIDANLRMSKLGLLDIYDQADLELDENLLVIVDQFEELFRYSQFDQSVGESIRSDEAIAFVNLLLEVTKQTEFPIYVVITMRSDFLGDCAQFYGLAEAINFGQYLVPRLSRIERREAIQGPIEMMGAQISPVLLTQLVNDVGDNPDQLSILQHALNRTWACWQAESNSQEPLNLVHYQAIGTMAQALDQHANKAFNELKAGQQLICETLFKAITDKATDARGVRRPTEVATLCQLTNTTQAELEDVLSVFRKSSRSFLMPPEGEVLNSRSMIDISHESLMRVWETLNRWADEEAQSARFYLRLTETWRLYCENKSQLLQDRDLSSAIEWEQTNQPSEIWASRYNSDFENVRQFIASSIKQENEEKNKAERARIADEKAKIREAELTQQGLAKERELKKQRKYNVGLAVAMVCTAVGTAAAIFGFYAAAKQGFNHQLRRELSEISKHQNTDEAQLLQSLSIASKSKQDFWQRTDFDTRIAILASLRKYSDNLINNAKKGHVGSVLDAKFSPKHSQVISAGQDGKAKLWTTKGEWIKDFLHGEPVRQVAFSPDGKMIATASNDDTVILWSSEGKEIKLLQHSSDVTAIKFSDDSNFLVTGSDNTVNLWSVNPDPGKVGKVWTKKGPQDTVNAVDISNDIVVSGSSDGTVHIWTLEGISLTAPIHDEYVTDVTISPRGSYIATASYDDTIQVVSYDKQKNRVRPVKTLKHDDDVNTIIFSPNGNFLASASDDKTVRVWTVEGSSKDPVVSLEDTSIKADNSASKEQSDSASKEQPNVSGKSHEDWVSVLAFNAKGTSLVSGSKDSTVKLWHTESGKWSDGQFKRVWNEHEGEIQSVEFSPDNQTIASSSNDGTIKLRPVEGEGKTVSLDSNVPSIHQAQDGCQQEGQGAICPRPHPSGVKIVEISPDGKSFVTATNNSTLSKFSLDAMTEDPMILSPNHQGIITDLKISPNGKLIASGSYDDTVNLFQEDGTLIRQIVEHTQDINAIEFSTDSRLLVTASDDGHIGLWNTTDGKGSLIQDAHEDWVRDIAFSPTEQLFASASDDSSVKLWDYEGNLIKHLKGSDGHKGNVLKVVFSPDGKLIASLSDDQTIKLWNRKGRLQQTLKNEYAYWSSMSFSQHQNDQLIAASDSNGRVTIWDYDGEQKGEFQLQDSEQDSVITQISFIPELNFIVVTSDQGHLEIRTYDAKSTPFIVDLFASLNPHAEAKKNTNAINHVRSYYSPQKTLTLISAREDNRAIQWNLGLDLDHVISESCKLILPYLKFNPHKLARVSSCTQDSEIRKTAAPYLASQARRFFEQKKWVKSLDRFKLALAWDPTLDLLPQTEKSESQFKEIKHYIEAHKQQDLGRKLASARELKSAKQAFTKSLKLYPSIDLSPDIEGVQNDVNQVIACVAAPKFIEEGNRVAKYTGDVKLATQNFEKALELNPRINIEEKIDWNDFAIDDCQLEKDTADQALEKEAADQEPHAIASRLSAPFYVKQGVKFSQKGELDKATDAFKKAKQFDNEISLSSNFSSDSLSDPQAAAQYYDVLFNYIEPAIKTAQEGRIQESAQFFQSAQKELPSSINLASIVADKLKYYSEIQRETPLELAHWIAARTKVEEAPTLTTDSDSKNIDMTMLKFKEALKLDSNVDIPVEQWNALCWFGSLKGKAQEVLFACNNAVNSPDMRIGHQDSRGLALTLIGKRDEALLDFEAVIASGDFDPNLVPQRQGWVDCLKSQKTDCIPISLFDELWEQ